MKFPSSRHILLALLAAGLLVTSGCSLYDMAFAMFGSGYSGGGGNWSDRQSHYERSVDRMQGRSEGVVGDYDPVLDR